MLGGITARTSLLSEWRAVVRSSSVKFYLRLTDAVSRISTPRLSLVSRQDIVHSILESSCVVEGGGGFAERT